MSASSSSSAAASASSGRLVTLGDERLADFLLVRIVHVTGSRRWPNSAASFPWARWDRDFTVPMGTPSCAEISSCVSPSRCWRRTTAASPGGSSSMAVRTCHTASRLSRSGGRVMIVGIADRDLVEGHRRPARFATMDVDGNALGDRRQPRRRVALGVEPVGGLPSPHEGLLCGLFGQLGLTEGTVRDGMDEPAVGPVEGADGGRLAPTEGGHDRRLDASAGVGRTRRLALLVHVTRRPGQLLHPRSPQPIPTSHAPHPPVAGERRVGRPHEACSRGSSSSVRRPPPPGSRYSDERRQYDAPGSDRARS